MQQTFSKPEPATSGYPIDLSIEENLTNLACSDLDTFRNVFKRTRETSPEQVARACLRHLADHGLDDAGHLVLDWLTQNTNYLPFLLKEDFLPWEKVESLAGILRQADPRFTWKFHLLSSDPKLTYSEFLQALKLFDFVSDSALLTGWVRGFANHSDSHIRSHAVKKLCELVPRTATITKQLESEDPRVRANAIEALWSIESPDVLLIFRQSLSDTHHRVVVNALVGLYRRNVEGALEKLVSLAEHPSAMVRSAAAWGMGAIADRRCIPALQKLTEDRAKAVRSRALHSLSLFSA